MERLKYNHLLYQLGEWITVSAQQSDGSFCNAEVFALNNDKALFLLEYWLTNPVECYFVRNVRITDDPNAT